MKIVPTIAKETKDETFAETAATSYKNFFWSTAILLVYCNIVLPVIVPEANGPSPHALV